MAAPIILPSADKRRPINPMVMDAFATAAGEINDPADYASESFLPPVNMGFADSGATGTIQRIADQEMIVPQDLVPRASNADIDMSSGVNLDPITFALEEWSKGVEVPIIDDEDTQGIDLYGTNIADIFHILKLAQEIRLDTFTMGGTWHPSDGNVANKWNTSSGDPIGDIATACSYIPGANAILMNREVAMTVGKNATVRAFEPDNTRRHFVGKSALAAYLMETFGLRLVVSGARKSVSNTESYVVRDSVWIGRVATDAVEIGPRNYRVHKHGAIRMASQIRPNRHSQAVKATLLSRLATNAEGMVTPVGGKPTLWLLEEFGVPLRRGEAGTLGHREKLVQTSAVGGWVWGDVL